MLILCNIIPSWLYSNFIQYIGLDDWLFVPPLNWPESARDVSVYHFRFEIWFWKMSDALNIIVAFICNIILKNYLRKTFGQMHCALPTKNRHQFECALAQSVAGGVWLCSDTDTWSHLDMWVSHDENCFHQEAVISVNL